MKKIALSLFPFLALSAICLNTSCNKNNAKKENEGDLIYLQTSDGYCVDSLNNQDRSKITTITVPSTYNGKPVVEISKGAFKGCSNLTSITLPFIGHTKTSTGEGGLFGYIFGDEIWEGAGSYTWQCYSLNDEYEDEPSDYSQFVIPYNLKSVVITNATNVSAGAFSMCKFLREIKFTDTCNISEIGNFAFYTCTALKTFNFPNGLTTIGRRAFTGCYNLFSLDVPDGVTNIKHNAFSNCISCSKVTIPKTVNKMGKYVFENFLSGVILLKAKEAGANWDPNWSNDNATIVYDYDGGGFYFSESCQVALCGSGDNKYAFLMQWTGPTSGDVTIPGSITINGKEYPIKTLGPCIFQEETEIRTITLSENIETISPNVFEKCTGLESVKFPTSIKSIGNGAFLDCTNLKTLDFSNTNLIEIKNEAFKNCTALKTIKFNDKLTTIGDSAFENDDHITADRIEGGTGNYLVFPSSLTSIGELAFANTFKYRYGDGSNSNVGIVFEKSDANAPLTIGKGAFKSAGVRSTTDVYTVQVNLSIDFNNRKIESFNEEVFRNSYINKFYNFPTEVKYFKDYCFSYAYIRYFSIREGEKVTNYQEYKFDEHVEEIGAYSFYNAQVNFDFSNLTNLDKIGNYAFQSCNYKNFNKITIPANISTIGSGAFNGCSFVDTVTLLVDAEGVCKLDTINTYAFSSMNLLTKFGTEADMNKYPNTVVVPETVTYISHYAFQYNKSMTSVRILGELTYLGYNTFTNCVNLTEIHFAKSLNNCTYVGSSLFNGCTSLETIDVVGVINHTATSVTAINSYTYKNCQSLTGFTITSNITSIGTYAFANCSKLEQVEFSDGGSINYIYDSAFSSCTSLKTFVMPLSVHTICKNAFAGCTLLGTESPFRLSNNLTKEYTVTGKKGMGVNVFQGWGANQYILLNQYNGKHSDNEFVTHWGWTLKQGGNVSKFGKTYYSFTAEDTATKTAIGGTPTFILEQ